MTTITEYYQNLLLTQYQEQPKAMSTIAALVECAVCGSVLRAIEAAFDVETAVGDQLDVLGEYIGFPRRVLAQADRDYFRLVDYESPADTTGFTEYETVLNPLSVFLRYTMLTDTFADLEDEDYRVLLKLKLVSNSIDNTMYSIAELLWDYFGDGLICFDNKDMSISYVVKASSQKIGWLALQQNLLPKPMGVNMAGMFAIEDYTTVWGMELYGEPYVGVGWCDYATGFDGNYWLDYSDKITLS